MFSIFVETLGCKINQYESACMVDDFLARGFIVSDSMVKADIIIINTCTVTNRTDYKSRHLINKARKIKQINNEVKILVTGCYSQRNRDEIMQTGQIDLIVDNNSKNRIFEYLNKLYTREFDTCHFAEAKDFEDFSEMNMQRMRGYNRAFLKIQDGCDFFCSYCAVPFARGKPRSRSFESIIFQVKKLLSAGYNEIVLSGVNLGLFNFEEFDLADLLYKLSEFHDLKKIRLSSIEPQLFSDKLLDAIQSIEKVCPHFHIPLQTGSDYLLKTHQRKYTVSKFLEILQKLFMAKPFAAIGLDLIVGLPFETDALFDETYELLRSIDFAYLHVFVYSKRKGTSAASMKGQVHGSIAKERSERLLKLSLQKKTSFIETLVKNQVFLYASKESYDDLQKMWYGTSDRYVKVFFQSVHFPFDQNDRDSDMSMKILLPKSHMRDGVFCEEVL